MKIEKVHNQIHPSLVGVGINLNLFPWSTAASRLLMCGNYIPKAVPVSGRSVRRLTTGFERQYGKRTRKIFARANMVVDGVFYQRNIQPNETLIDNWTEVQVVFFNEELGKYDVLEMPKYNTQNSYIAWEYVYNKELMRRLMVGATYKKGDVFGHSPNLSETGEWTPGLEVNVAGLSHSATEEDAIIFYTDFIDMIKATFEHKRGYSWDESEWIPLNLYGTKDHPRAFPENGEKVRKDGIVMGFRKRYGGNALTSLTKKALMQPDTTYDYLLYAPVGSEVQSVVVKSDRNKNRANNRSIEKLSQPHNHLLEQYEAANNTYQNEVKNWYFKTARKYNDGEIPMTGALWQVVYKALGNITFDTALNKYNMTKRSTRNKVDKDWTVTIILKEDVRGKVRFKLSDMQGCKGVGVLVLPSEMAPVDDYGRRAHIVVNRTPSFRRQIYGALMEASINFINLHVHDRVKLLLGQGNPTQAWDELTTFYRTVSPEYGKLIDDNYFAADARMDHLQYVADNMISVQRRSDSKLFGVDIIRALQKQYGNVKPTPVTYIDEMGHTIRTLEPCMISSSYYILLDKFGTEMSSQSLPKLSLFGMGTRLNKADKYREPFRDVGDRNTGETEGRNKISQMGGQETAKVLALSYSPQAIRMATKRIIRADNPFRVKQIIKPEEYITNRMLRIGKNMLSDTGYCVRRERPSDIIS